LYPVICYFDTVINPFSDILKYISIKPYGDNSLQEPSLDDENGRITMKFFQALQNLPKFESNIFIGIRYNSKVDGERPLQVIAYDVFNAERIGFFFEGGSNPDIFRLNWNN
jgi:hypothetical protein